MHHEAATDALKVETVRSQSTDVRGRALVSARTQHFVVDSSTGPGEALFPAEVFLAGISACGVHLTERFADEFGIPLRKVDVTIESARLLSAPATFRSVELRFVLDGPTQAQAERLVEAYQAR